MVEEGRRQEHDGDAVRFELRRQRVGRESYVLLDDDEARARQQGTPDLEGGGVEGAVRNLRHHVRLLNRDVVRAADEVVNRPVRDSHAFRLPSRTRGINDVGEVLRASRRYPALRFVRSLFVAPFRVETDGVAPIFVELLREHRLCEQHVGLRVVEHKREPFLWVRRVERDVSAARFEHTKHADNHLSRTLHTYADQRSWPDAKAAKAAC